MPRASAAGHHQHRPLQSQLQVTTNLRLYLAVSRPKYRRHARFPAHQGLRKIALNLHSPETLFLADSAPFASCEQRDLYFFQTTVNHAAFR